MSTRSSTAPGGRPPPSSSARGATSAARARQQASPASAGARRRRTRASRATAAAPRANHGTKATRGISGQPRSRPASRTTVNATKGATRTQATAVRRLTVARVTDRVAGQDRRMDLLDRLEIEHPVVQAGMGGGVAGSSLAGAVSRAGGLGTVGILPPDVLGAPSCARARERADGRPVERQPAAAVHAAAAMSAPASRPGWAACRSSSASTAGSSPRCTRRGSSRWTRWGLSSRPARAAGRGRRRPHRPGREPGTAQRGDRALGAGRRRRGRGLGRDRRRRARWRAPCRCAPRARSPRGSGLALPLYGPSPLPGGHAPPRSCRSTPASASAASAAWWAPRRPRASSPACPASPRRRRAGPPSRT